MVSLAKMSAKYQITIPSEIREKIGAKPGDRVVFQTNANGEVVIRAISQVSAKELAGSLKRTVNTLDTYRPSNQSNSTGVSGALPQNHQMQAEGAK